MLKVRILAALMAIVLTLLTIWVLPKIVYAYTTFMDGLTADQKTTYSLAQAALGAALGGYGWWLWKKAKAKKQRGEDR